MEAIVEELATTTPAVVTEVSDDGQRVVVECAGRQMVFTLRRLTARYVEESQPYYGTRLRLLDGPSRP
jgi:hypothetical protein